MHYKKATYNQRKILNKAGIDTRVWYIKKIEKDGVELVRPDTGEIKWMPGMDLRNV